MNPKVWYPLSVSFKPTQVMFREKQLHQLIEMTTHPIPSNVWVQGDKGHGKTLTGDILSEELSTRDVTCYNLSCKKSIKATLIDLNVRYNLGLSTYRINEIEVLDALKKRSKNRITFIIDEPLNLPSRYLKDLDDLIFDWYEILLNSPYKFNFIFLSQMRYMVALRTFAPDTLSRFQLKPILFPSYTAPQIITILQRRLSLMLEPDQYQPVALGVLAKHIKRIGGDMRQALDILRLAIENAKNKITSKSMTQAINLAKIRWWLHEMNSLPPHWALILTIAAMQCGNSNYNVTSRKKMLQTYLTQSTKQKFDPLSVRTVYYAINKLAEKGYFLPDETDDSRKELFVMDPGDQKRIVEASKKLPWELLL